MAAAIFADENVPRNVIEALRRHGHDVLTCQQAGKAGQRVPDEDILKFAIEQGRAVLTLNRRDFFRLAARIPDHAGIIACTEDIDCERQAARIDEAIRAHGDLRGKVVRVNRPPVG
jgi:hypothetical protein